MPISLAAVSLERGAVSAATRASGSPRRAALDEPPQALRLRTDDAVDG